MDTRTVRFLAFTAFSLACLLAGYLSRKRGWVREEFSQTLHLHTVLWLWSITGVFSLWLLPIHRELLWMVLILPVVMAVAVFSTLPLAKWIGCTRPQIGVMAIGAGISNCGVTLGAYLCYCLLTPHAQALAYGNAFASWNLLVAVPMIYPVAQHYSMHEGHEMPIPRLIFTSIFNIRSLGLLGGIVGLALSAIKAPFPQWVKDHYVLDALSYAAALGGYFGIGLRLRLGDSTRHFAQHALLACMKFAVFPLTTYLLVRLLAHHFGALPAMLHDTMLMQSFVPVGTSVVILSNLFDLDARLASILWICNTAIYMLVPFWGIVWGFR